MPNVIKYSVGATPSGSLRKGNMLIGNNTADYGATFFNGINPPSGGYTIYLNKASGGPSIYCPANNTQLIFITNQIVGANFTTAAQCLDYFAGQTDKIVVNMNYEGIVTSGLVLNYDAGFLPSYPTTGSTWYNISGNASNGTMVTSTIPTYSDVQPNNFNFSGSLTTNTNAITVPTSNILQVSSSFSIEVWMNRDPNISALTDRESIFSNTGGANGFRFQIGGPSSLYYLIGGVAGIGYSEGTLTSNTPVADGEWHQVGVMFDIASTQGSCKVYGIVDGVIVNSVDISPLAISMPLDTAGISYGCCSSFKGKVLSDYLTSN